MLQSLDTLIAFTVIMTIVSLFVTIMVQMLSAALSLRGKNLANALALTFQTIDPTLDKAAHDLAAQILSDPLLTGSTNSTRNVGTAIPTTRDKPWHFLDLAQGSTKLATAIRPDEVYAALQKIATQPAGAHPLTPQATTLLAALGTTPAITSRATGVLTAFDAVAPLLPPAALAAFNAALSQSSATLVTLVDTQRAKFEDWFATAQNRSQEWFQMHTRGLTIAASILLAFVFQLDVVEVYHHASTPSAARDALLASAAKIEKDAAAILGDNATLLQKIADAYTTPRKLATVDTKGLTDTVKLGEKLKAADPKFDASAYDQLVADTTKTFYADERTRLDDLSRGLAAGGFDIIPARGWRWPVYEPEIPVPATSASAQKKTGDTTHLQPINGWSSLGQIFTHFFGILLFSGLLSLGAPYWYNVLKTLSSLRPALAQIIGAEEKPAAAGKK